MILYSRILGSEGWKLVGNPAVLNPVSYPDVHMQMQFLTNFPIPTVAWRTGRVEWILVNDDNW